MLAGFHHLFPPDSAALRGGGGGGGGLSAIKLFPLEIEKKRIRANIIVMSFNIFSERCLLVQHPVLEYSRPYVFECSRS